MSRIGLTSAMNGMAMLNALEAQLCGPNTPVPPLPNPLIWLRSDQALFQSNAGTTPATADGDVVGYWTDISGNTRPVKSAADNTTRPILKLNQIAGYPAIRFDGSNDLLQATWSQNKPVTIFVACKPITFTSGRVILGAGSGDNSNVYFFNGTDIGYYDGNNAVNTGAGGTVWSIFCGAGDPPGGGNGRKVRYNAGTAATSGLTGTSTQGGITVGAHPNPSNYANVDVAEVLMYGSWLNTTDEATVRNYLNGRYSIY